DFADLVFFAPSSGSAAFSFFRISGVLGGRKRNAALASFNTLSRRLTMMETLAVMPGLSLRDGLLTSMTVTYMTTFWSALGALRICVTLPWKTWPGKASTVHSTS